MQLRTRGLASDSPNLPEGTEYYASQAAMSPETRRQMEEYAYRFGRSYDSYLLTEPDREYFWCRGRRGILGFVTRFGRYVHVAGGLVAAEADRGVLLSDFMEFAKANRLVLFFYGVPADDVDLFRRYRCQITKVGEEPIVDLTRAQWSGGAYAWVRRQENYCRRRGAELVEVVPDPDDPRYRDRIAPELEVVSAEHLSQTVRGKEMEFFEARFTPRDLRRRRLFTAIVDGRIDAFVVCNPCCGGDMWAIEMFRRRPDALRGIVPFAMLGIMRRLADEGVSAVSLSLAPGVRCGAPRPGDSGFLRWGIDFWWRRLSWVFDLPGLHHYKSRFRPGYREAYIVAVPAISFLPLYTFVMTWKVFRVSPLRLLRHGSRKWRKRVARRSLAPRD